MTSADQSSRRPASAADSARPLAAAAARLDRRRLLAVVGSSILSTLAGCSATEPDSMSPLHGGAWYSFGNGPGNPNAVGGGAPRPQRHDSLIPARWLYTPPVVADGIAYYGTDREVVALDTTGNEQWSRRLETEVTGAPALDPDRGRLYVPTRITGPTEETAQRATLSVVSVSGGELLDSYRVGDERTYGATVVEGDVFVRSDSACLKLAADGTERWRQSLDALVYDEYNLGDSTATQIVPAVAGDGVYVPDRNALVKLDRERGDERFRIPVDTPYAAPTVDDGGLIQTGYQETVAVSRSGEVRWRRDLSSRAAAAASDGEIYVVANDFHCLTADSGTTRWQTHLPSEGTAAPVVTDDSVIVASGDVRAFRRRTDGLIRDDRTRWEYTNVQAHTYASPVVAAGRILVSGAFGLVALDAGTDS